MVGRDTFRSYKCIYTHKSIHICTHTPIHTLPHIHTPTHTIRSPSFSLPLALSHSLARSRLRFLSTPLNFLSHTPSPTHTQLALALPPSHPHYRARALSCPRTLFVSSPLLFPHPSPSYDCRCTSWSMLPLRVRMQVYRHTYRNTCAKNSTHSHSYLPKERCVFVCVCVCVCLRVCPRAAPYNAGQGE